MRIGGTDMRALGNVLVSGDHRFTLSERERAVLEALAARRGAVVSRSTLLRTVWGDGTTDAHVVDVTVSRLRRRLGPLGSFVKTRQSRGYWLEATP